MVAGEDDEVELSEDDLIPVEIVPEPTLQLRRRRLPDWTLVMVASAAAGAAVGALIAM